MLLAKAKTNGKFVKLIPLSICLLTVFMFSSVLQVKAAYKNNESVQSFFFTSPRGQTASVRAKATIKEEYSSRGSNSIFTYRDCFLCCNRAYSVSAPRVIRGHGVHKTSVTGSTVKTFSPWNTGSYLWDTRNYPSGGGSYNRTSVTYSKRTSYVSGFAYTVHCSGALVPIRAGSVYTSLKTN